MGFSIPGFAMTEAVKSGVAQELSTEHRSLWSDVWRQFCKHKGALVGVVVFVLIALTVFFGPYFYAVDPNAHAADDRRGGKTKNR